MKFPLLLRAPLTWCPTNTNIKDAAELSPPVDRIADAIANLIYANSLTVMLHYLTLSSELEETTFKQLSPPELLASTVTKSPLMMSNAAAHGVPPS